MRNYEIHKDELNNCGDYSFAVTFENGKEVVKDCSDVGTCHRCLLFSGEISVERCNSERLYWLFAESKAANSF